MKFLEKMIMVAVLLQLGSTLMAAEYHVSQMGSDAATGTQRDPLKTISAAAEKAQPGDVITVHEGVYRERINPPRGGTSDTCRITYQAAPGEKVTITGSEQIKGWNKIAHDTWALSLSSNYFGDFNPYAEKVYGDWFNGNGRIHRRGNVYLKGHWLAEAPNLDSIMKPTGNKPMWFSKIDGMVDDSPSYLMNIVSFKPDNGTAQVATKTADRSGPKDAPSSVGGQCVGFISSGSWLRYDSVDFGNDSKSIEIMAAASLGAGGVIELRDGHFDGELLGTCEVDVTGDWQKWQPFTAKIKKTSGMKNLYMVFKSRSAVGRAREIKDTDKTTIYAQLPGGIDPNEGDVEICVRETVFSPEKTNINYITVRGFDLRNAASNWAAPTSGQQGLVTAYWCKGWIIENNEISYSRCCGIALGKNSDQWDNKRGNTEGYYLTIDDALKKDGWSKENIGSHVVRNNHIHHCGQAGIIGSLGCAFSRIENNEIHDINLQGIWRGAEMGGIKLHGAIDVIIKGNHIYRCGSVAALWLDWMAQGTQVIGNLFHDNIHRGDLFCEVNHGPCLIANNIFLSSKSHSANSQGSAYVHNLISGSLQIIADGRKTPFHKPHKTEMIALHNCPIGDVRLYNNWAADRANLDAFNRASLPVAMAGNIYTKGAKPSSFDKTPLQKPEFDPGIKLIQKADGWYLELSVDTAWATEQQRQMATTELLGKAIIPNQSFTNPDDSPLKIDTDYFGNKRNEQNPFPGPFAQPKDGKQTIKVWPKDN